MIAYAADPPNIDALTVNASIFSFALQIIDVQLHFSLIKISFALF
jgi:hypothetical protein